MVLRPYLGKYGLPFTARAASSTAASPTAAACKSASKQTANLKFFNPSYIPPNELIDITARSHHSGSGKKGSTFKYIAPVVSMGKNYIVLAKAGSKEDDTVINPIVLKKLTSQRNNNKNSHINIRVLDKSSREATITMRRSNSNVLRTFTIQKRLISTASQRKEKPAEEASELDSLAKDMAKVNLDQDYAFIQSMLDVGKINEVLPVFNRIRSNEKVPSIEVYNVVLQSIRGRTCDETIEQKLTHLLNTYSDMLSNDLKPNGETYHLVIDALFEGSLASFNEGKFQNGFDFFKIGLDLCLISTSNKDIVYDEQVYFLMMDGLINYKLTDAIKPQKIVDEILPKISQENKSEFLIKLMTFGGIAKDSKFVHEIYSQLQKTTELNDDKHTIYLSLIESLNFLGEFNSSKKMLDEIIADLENDHSNDSLISQYISKYIQSQAMINPQLAYKSLVQFNQNTWLPDVSIQSILYLTSMFVQMQDLNTVNKLVNFALIRDDFENEYKQTPKDIYYPFISLLFNQYVEFSMSTQNTNQVFKASREILVKNIELQTPTLSKLVQYLNHLGHEDMATQLVLAQGKSENNLNFFFSSLVDSFTNGQILKLLQSSLFKAAIEQYRLINDNIYGIMKMFSQIPTNMDDHLKLKIRYYAKVLDFEFDDVDNCYIGLPDELVKFKQDLKSYI